MMRVKNLFPQITQINSKIESSLALNKDLVFSAVICGHLWIKVFKDFLTHRLRR
jgi:hypothetical protein